MHIADGILPAGVSVAADVAALGLVYAGGRKLEAAEIPKMGIFAAALFIVSLIHFPLGATSIHLGLYGLAGLLFGLRAFPIIFVDLLFQTLIFQHGGLLSVGINTITMGCGALSAWGIWKIFKTKKQIAGFICGFIGIAVPAVL
ncbi:MAG: cobalamin biosynthesis protein CbiM, partial [bacterium]|nr:cobalamin biosynthesis protein CbiM [bacterium]